MHLERIVVFLCSCIYLVQGQDDTFLRLCYFTEWAKWKTSPLAKFDVGDIDPYICTHLVYAFATIDRTQKTIAPLEAAELDRYKNFNSLKAKNSKLKTLISIGGQTYNNSGFLDVTINNNTLSSFVNNTITFLRVNSFDGLDIDWEYPNRTTSSNFVRLLQALRYGFDSEPTGSTGSRLLLTVAVPGGQEELDNGFNIPEIDKYVDYVNIMTYDYSTPDSEVAVFNSPLYSRNDVRFDPTLSTNWTVFYLKQLGLRFSKMLIGFTGVGRWLVLKNTSLTAVGSPVTGVQRTSPDYYVAAGLVYPEICQVMLRNAGSKRYFDEIQKMPYLVNGDSWVGYEDVESIEYKTKYGDQLGVAGMMFWSIDQDDFSGTACNDGKFPLLTKIKSITEAAVIIPSTITTTVRTSTTASRTATFPTSDNTTATTTKLPPASPEIPAPATGCQYVMTWIVTVLALTLVTCIV